MNDDPRPVDPDETHTEEFQFVLKQLLAAYQPILEEDLKRAKAPEELKKEEREKPPSCEDEITFANRIFDRFLTDEVALRLLPEEGRTHLGPIERWRWCLLHIRCCIVFGWLVCRGPRTFKAFVYYLYRYWLCVRQAVATPVHSPLTADERQDFQTLVQTLADAYKPYLTDQLSTVEFPLGVPDEVLRGTIDCLEGHEEAAAVFERLLTVETAAALLGKEAFARHSQESWFWFCRCWCLCSIRFGCCLARARTFVDVLRCLRSYRVCLRQCLRPLTCELTAPDGCVEEDAIEAVGILRGVEIKGTAAGAFCSHYTLEWREAGTVTWQSGGIRYPGTPAPSQGVCGVVNGTLGYLETFPLVPAGPVEIRLCVHSTQPGVAPHCCTILFELQRNLVWIRGIEGIDAATPPGILDSTAQLVDGVGVVRSFGTALRIFGSASVGGCEGRNIKRYTLSYTPGFVGDPLAAVPWTQFWQVDYNTPLQIDSDLNKIFERELTSRWRELKLCLPFPPYTCFTIANYLQGVHWSTQVPQPYPVEPPGPPFWSSTPLAITNCHSGKYTIRLMVEDEAGGIKYDIQQAWFDNKTDGIYKSKITQVSGVPACATIELGQFAAAGADCTLPWPASLLGIAFDEYIEEGNGAVPSDNFGGYTVSIRKDGGPWFSLPVPGPGAPPWGGPFIGTSRVGDPGARCATASPPPGAIPPETPGILALIDMRRLDAVCNPAEPGLTLKRGKRLPDGTVQPGECCGYIIHLKVWDTTICPSEPYGRHQREDSFPFYICNNLIEP
jgi:hypothetical protein